MKTDSKKDLFETMPVPRALAALAIPTIISQLITMIYNLADTYFIGMTDDPYKVAAASVTYILYQIFTYVKNKDTEFGDEPHRVSGMLLYVATDEAIQPNNRYGMSGNQISVKTLDLNRNFSEIAAQLNAIMEEHFS